VPGRPIGSLPRVSPEFSPHSDALGIDLGDAGTVIEIQDLTKRYRGRAVVDRLSFDVKPGAVTGFLGPNGAGKTSTLRILLGLARPDAGTALIGGRSYADLDRPLCHVGALIDAGSIHSGRSARAHLTALAAANGISRGRVGQVLDMVGMDSQAGVRVGKFSLGMRQRLGIAAALLGDPSVLILDEPINGLDPDGVRWIRELLRGLASEGRTVLLSSHLMSEMELTADRLVIIGRGAMIADTSVAELAAEYSQGVSVRSPQTAELTEALARVGAQVRATSDGALIVTGPTAPQIAELAAGDGIVLHEVSSQKSTLEDAYMRLTADASEFRGGDAR